MRAPVRRWGNSLALRIPKALAERSHLAEGTEVELADEGGRLVVTPVSPSPSLADLLARVTDDNQHGEVGTGPPVRREA